MAHKSMQLVDGVPLVGRAIAVAEEAAAGKSWRVAVSTDCPQIQGLARRRGVEVIERPPELAGPAVPLREVAAHAARIYEDWDVLIMLEPTSIGVVPEDLHQLVAAVGRGGVSAGVLVEPTHRQTWFAGKRITPYVNRQYHDSVTATDVGVVAMRRSWALGSDEGGESMVIAQGAIIDIDSYADLAIADHRARRRTVWIRCIGAPETGTGHVQRCLRLAEALRRRHDVHVDVIDCAQWAMERFASRGLVPLPDDQSADVIVSDCLDKWAPPEELGGPPVLVLEPNTARPEGQRYVVVDELSGSGAPLSGPRWAVLREEFAVLPFARESYRDRLERVVVTCGGSDPSGMGYEIAAHRALAGKSVRLIVGPQAELPVDLGRNVEVVQDADMASELWEADLVICSRGRTQYEAARAAAPMIVVAANRREELNGVLPGVRALARSHLAMSLAASVQLLESRLAREASGRASRLAVDDKGVDRIVHLIEGMVHGLRPEG